jgi:hypothetical protein
MLRAALFFVRLGPLSAGAQTNLAPGFANEAIVTREGSAFTLERLAPASFCGAQGFLFEHTTVPRDGPALGGLAYGAVVGGKLYLMSYTAPRSYFYAKHLAQVKAIAASARINDRKSAANFTNRETAASASP